MTDNGVQFTWQLPQWLPGGHRFARICRAFGVERRLTKPAPPWPNGQVERMHRANKAATVQRFDDQATDELKEYLPACWLAYNHAKRLKPLRGLTPQEVVGAQRQKTPTIFTPDPTHLTLGLYRSPLAAFRASLSGSAAHKRTPDGKIGPVSRLVN